MLSFLRNSSKDLARVLAKWVLALLLVYISPFDGSAESFEFFIKGTSDFDGNPDSHVYC